MKKLSETALDAALARKAAELEKLQQQKEKAVQNRRLKLAIYLERQFGIKSVEDFNQYVQSLTIHSEKSTSANSDLTLPLEHLEAL